MMLMGLSRLLLYLSLLVGFLKEVLFITFVGGEYMLGYLSHGFRLCFLHP